jgi:hypothetical protein
VLATEPAPSATPPTCTDAINGSQLQAAFTAISDTQAHYLSVNDNGVVGGNYGNDGAIGVNSFAAGVGTVANGAKDVAIGPNATTLGDICGGCSSGNVAIGSDASAKNTFLTTAVAIGSGARAESGVAIGEAANSAVNGVAVGTGSARPAAAPWQWAEIRRQRAGCRPPWALRR